jgi:acyl carrier protein
MVEPEPAIKHEVKKLLSTLSRIEIAEMEDDVRIREELGIDSLLAMEIVANCEKHWGIIIEEERLLKIETVGDFVDLVVSLVIDHKHFRP